MAYLWNPVPSPVFTASGRFASGALAYFYVGGTTTPLVVYTSAALTTPHPSPVVADQNGIFPPIFLPYGTYRRRILDQNGTLLSDADNIDNPAPPASGGGIVVSADMAFQTGDPIWRMKLGPMTGWVRMNGLTIGSHLSSATERANDDTQNLFLFLWNNFADGIAAVSTGRGGSAAADYAANKTIVVPSMYQRGALNVDSSGTEIAGTAVGAATKTLITAEMPAHTHVLTDPGHVHGTPSPQGAAGYANGGTFALNSGSGGAPITTASATTGITIDSTGSGTPFSILQPARLGQWFLKL